LVAKLKDNFFSFKAATVAKMTVMYKYDFTSYCMGALMGAGLEAKPSTNLKHLQFLPTCTANKMQFLMPSHQKIV